MTSEQHIQESCPSVYECYQNEIHVFSWPSLLFSLLRQHLHRAYEKTSEYGTYFRASMIVMQSMNAVHKLGIWPLVWSEEDLSRVIAKTTVPADLDGSWKHRGLQADLAIIVFFHNRGDDFWAEAIGRV